MRFSHYLVLLAMFAAVADAEDFRVTPMPAGGLPVVQPGFSFRSPGLGWFLAGRIKPDNGVIRGGERFEKLYFSNRSEGWADAVVSVEIVRWPVTMVGTPDLKRYLREHSLSGGPSTNSRIRETVKDEVVNGAACAVWRSEFDQKLKPDAPLTTSFSERRVCAHPDMPGFALDLQYYSQAAKDYEEIAAVIASFRFTPVPYRVREIRPGCNVGQMVEADGALWTVCRPDRFPTAGETQSAGKVLRIDPATNSLAAAIEVGRDPWTLAAAGGQIWVGDMEEKKVVRIDPKSNAVTATVDLPGLAIQILPAAGFIWVPSFVLFEGPSLLRINTASASVDANIPVDGIFVGVAAGRWLLIENAKHGRLTRIDGRTGAVAGDLLLGRGVLDYKYDGRVVWFLQHEAGGTALLKFDPETAAPPERVRMLEGAVSDVLWWNGAFCTVDQQALRCRGAENGPVSEFPRPPVGLLAFAGSLWGPSVDGTAILRIDPK